MADISKQIDEGQEKWRQGVDLTSITDANNYIKFKILEYEYFKLINTTYGSNTRKTLRTLRKLFSRPVTLLPSVTYGPFYVTKVYGLKGTNELLLHGPYTIQYMRRTKRNGLKRKS